MCKNSRKRATAAPGLLLQLGLLAGFGLSTGLLGPALGTAMAQAIGQDQVNLQARRVYDIPAQSLAPALRSFGRQSGLQISVDAEAITGLQSRAVSGNHNADEVLQMLLAGTGMVYRMSGSGTVLLQKASASEPTALPPVKVEGNSWGGAAEDAWGAVPGYVAQRSATGTKFDALLIETPQSVSVVGREQIEAQGLRSLQQAFRYSAGMVPETRANFGGYDIMYSRGFVLDRYVDGMRLQGNAGFVTPQFDISNAERVEALRGPASILYGQGSPGGITNQVSRRPSVNPVQEVSLKAGTFDYFQGSFDVGGASEDHSVMYRLGGVARDAKTQVDYTEDKRIGVFPSLAWHPNESTSLTLLTNYQHDPSVGLYNFVPASGTVQNNVNGRVPVNFYAGDPSFNRMDRTQYGAGYLLEHEFDTTWTLRQNTRYLHVNGHMDQVLPLSLAANGRTLNRYAQFTTETTKAATLDNQAQAVFATGLLKHTMLLGFDLQHTTFDQQLGQALAPSIDLFAPVYYQSIARPALTSSTYQTQKQFGFYAQDQIKFDQWVLLLGGRQDWARSNSDNRIANTTTKQSDDAFSARAGLVYLFENGLAPYATYAESFDPVAGTAFGGTPFKPTTGQLYEAGLKFQPNGMNSFITGAVFDLTQQNVRTTDPLHNGFQVQIGEVKTRGLDFEAKLALAPGFNILANYTYLDAEVTKSNSTSLGKVPLYTPKHAAGLWADYSFQDGSMKGFGFGGGARYVGTTYGNDANTIVVPNFTLFDAALHYDFGTLGRSLQGLQLSVNANNLLDKEYISECTNNNCLYGVGRTVIATLRYRW